MDEITQDTIGKALYIACCMDEYPWDDILAKHVWVSRALSVVEAYIECIKCEEGTLQASDGFSPR